ncbi:uncharacterized protein AKAME5_000714600 [Lates japonicus]|uniref:Uncharacterized protein n=1 Tax=Lates japonicus TaxID=270547 RepID=A0AAD3MJ69_LATJO|nr:uncharacterized protein AKAME5_000714600 [Lates japonicus]
MRGLTLLCLIGFIHVVAGLWPAGSRSWMENKNGFNITTNSSMAPVESSEHNKTVVWNGTRPATENTSGVSPLSDDGEDTQGNTRK